MNRRPPSRRNDLVRAGSQLIIATHSPILLAYPDAQLLQLSEAELQVVRDQDNEHFLLTRRFLENPGRMLAELFRD